MRLQLLKFWARGIYKLNAFLKPAEVSRRQAVLIISSLPNSSYDVLTPTCLFIVLFVMSFQPCKNLLYLR